MYRVAKKTTKNTKGHCLKCKYSKEIQQISGEGVLVECTAENRCINSIFNANDFYCVEYKGANDMSAEKINNYIKKERIKKSKSDFRKYVNTYYPKEQAKKMIEEYNEKIKGF